jgi:hypothetical protein
VHTRVTLQKDAACCFVTDVEVCRTHEGKTQAVGVQKQGAGKTDSLVLMQGKCRRGQNLVKKRL